MQVLHGRNVGAVWLECRCHAGEMQIPHERLRTLRAVQNTSAGNKTTAQRSSAPSNAHQPLPQNSSGPHDSLNTPCDNFNPLRVTKCHHLSFGKCFDVTETCRQR